MWKRIVCAACLCAALGGCTGFAESMNPRSINLTAHRDFNTLIREFEPPDGRLDKLKMVDLTTLCGAYLETKKYTKLFPCLDAAEAKYATGDKYYYTFDFSPYALRGRVQAYTELGQFAKASAEADRLFALAARGDMARSIEISSLEIVGIAQAMNNEKAKALATLDRLKALYLGYPYNLLADDRNRAVALVSMALGDYAGAFKAVDYDFDKSSALLKAIAGGTIFSGAKTLHNYLQARSLFELGEYGRARAVYERLLALPNIADSGNIYWSALHDTGRILLRNGETDKALELFRRSVEAIEEYRSNISGESGKIGFVADKQAVYDTIIDTLARSGNAREAYGYVERGKARALVDLLAERESFAGQDALAQPTGQMLTQLAELEVQQTSLDPKLVAARSGLRSAVGATKRDIVQAAPELASLVTVTAADAGAIQRLLAADETLLEFYYHGDTLHAFTLTRNGLGAARLDGKGLEQEVRALREALKSYDRDTYKPMAQALYARLIAPLPEALGRPRLIIVAHGALHYLPWAALFDGRQFLVDKAALQMLPSASVMQFLSGRKPAATRDMLLLGNPDLGRPDMDLPGAEAEARAIKAIWPDSTMLTRQAATKSALHKAGQLFRIIHVAAHGEFLAEQPLASRLLLAPEGADNGQLTAGDLYGMRLAADLVTLSACETGMGAVLSGDDMVGLTRGFLYAGTNNIVASLWAVSDDETRFLMTSFYANLKRLPKAEALRQAQLDTRRRHPHPFFWSAFQLTGLGR